MQATATRMAENGRSGEPMIPSHFSWLTSLLPGHWAVIDDVIVGKVTVSPEAAKEIIDHHNKDNRSPIPGQIRKLARAMANGKFKFNGEAMVFDQTGNVRNGQNRCHACVESECPFQTLVVAGVGPETFHTFDQHGKRTPHHVLAMRGEANPKILSAAIPFIATFFKRGRVDRRLGGSVTIIDDDLLLLQENPLLRESVQFVHSHGKSVKPFGSVALVAALHYLFARVDVEDADRFFTSIFTVSIPEGPKWSGIRLLLKRLIHRQPSDPKLPTALVSAITIKAWNYYRQGRLLNTLKWSDAEDFPKIGGWDYNPDGNPIAPTSEVAESAF